MSGAQGVGCPEGVTSQINRLTILSTVTRERAVKANAMPPKTSAKRRLANDMVLVLATALARRPPMPAACAASLGLDRLPSRTVRSP